MERALLRAGFDAGLKRSALLQHHPIVRKHAFDTASKMMATVHERDNRYLFAIKGAPETVLEMSDRTVGDDGELALNEAMRAEWRANVERLGQRGLRVLACAVKNGTEADVSPYTNLTFIGLIGLEGPARVDVPKAIRDCRNAGIRVVMVTGDHAVTARSIGRAVGLGEATAHVIEGRHLVH
jgi:Ca2+-transporting ATPase